MRSAGAIAAIAFVALAPRAARADDLPVSYADVLRAARAVSPDLQVARAQEGVAKADVGIAGLYPNPSVAAGTNTQTARLTGTLSLPLVVFGQRGAAVEAARADQRTVELDTRVAWNDVRQSAAHAFVTLWLAQEIALARRESAAIQSGLESAVRQRVEVGSAPELDALRVHAERLRADTDVTVADADVAASAAMLGRWLGDVTEIQLRAVGTPPLPESPPSLATLEGALGDSVAFRREEADVAAAQAHADRERALVRPSLGLDLGFDAFDETLCGSPNCTPPVNFRGQVAIDVPIFNQRGAYVDHELARAEVARSRARATRSALLAELVAAYRVFDAARSTRRTLAESVVPAAVVAAKATEEAYSLGRAQLVAVLDAERAVVDAKVLSAQAAASEAGAWIDVEHSLGAS